MLTFIIALVLLSFALIGIALRKIYYFLPPKELKRQARSGDELAKLLYKAVAYGTSLQLLLWMFIGLTLAGGFVLLARIAPPLLAFLAVATLVWYGFAWMPSGHITRLSERLVIWLTPLVAWLLNYIHPVFDFVTSFVMRHRPVTVHTGLYEREDLIELLASQKQLPDSRIPHEELDIVMHALSFGDRLVRDVMVPRRVVKMVAESDVVGPIIMDELHDSGYSRFPVYEDNQDTVTGTLYLRDLIQASHGGHISDVMKRSVYYVHEDHTLYQVLHAFLKTKHHLYIVVNDFEEYVGIITIEDVIEQIIGRPIQDEFDKYEDMRAVAAQRAHKDHAENIEHAQEAVEEKLTDSMTTNSSK